MLFDICKMGLTLGVVLQGIIYFLILVIIYHVCLYYNKRHVFKFSKNYRSYPYFPVVGSYFHLRTSNLHDTLTKLADKFGDSYSIWVGYYCYYVTADIDDVKAVISHPEALSKSQVYDFFKMFIGDNFFVASVDRWKPRRKFYTKSFNQAILNTFVYTFSKNSELFVKDLEESKKTDLFLTSARYAFRNIYEILMTKEFDMDIKATDQLLEAFYSINKMMGEQLVKATILSLIFGLLFNNVFRTFQLAQKFTNHIYKVIKSKKKELEINPVVADTNLSLLDSVLSSKHKFSDKVINADILVIIIAAFETSNSALAFTFTLLGMNPVVQERVHDEIIKEIGREKPVEADDLPKLKYMERVIMESLRLFPPISVIGRFTNADIKCDTKTIPKGINILINIFRIHRSEKYWKNPLKFDPDRFLPEEVEKRPTHCYIPFSIGPRNCIGRVYAMMSLKTALACVVRKYQISSKYKSIDEIHLFSSISMKSTHPLDCHFKLRK